MQVPHGRILHICSPRGAADAFRAAIKLVSVQVDVVHGIQHAVEILRQRRFHAIIVTLRAATEEGWVEEVLGFLKGREDKLPAIVLTERKDAGLAERCRSAGVLDFLMMPAAPHAVVGVIRRALLRSGLIVPEDTASAGPQQPVRQFPLLIGKSDSLQKVLDAIAKAAESDANVCVYGETGTGKELVARAIHYSSHRRHRPMMVLDCSAVSEGLMESELFGHVKGSFTSAVADREGVFQLAQEGSLLFDEIGELSLPLQAKLLRVVQFGEFRKVGGKDPIKVDVRIMAATNRNLAEMATGGTFREDLFYRLEVLSIRLPALRERKEDIPLLVEHFIEKFNRHNQKQIHGVRSKTLAALLSYDWPGNVRELENCIERAAVLTDGPMLSIEEPTQLLRSKDLTGGALVAFNDATWPLNLKEAEKIVVRRVLQVVGGDKTRAAELLGISLRTLYYKLKEPDGGRIPCPRSVSFGQAELPSVPKVG